MELEEALRALQVENAGSEEMANIGKNVGKNVGNMDFKGRFHGFVLLVYWTENAIIDGLSATVQMPQALGDGLQ